MIITFITAHNLFGTWRICASLAFNRVFISTLCSVPAFREYNSENKLMLKIIKFQMQLFVDRLENF